MQALVFRATHRMGLEDVPDPVPEPGGLTLRIMAAAICGTDMRIYKGSKTRGVRAPAILGHEFAGVIEASAAPEWRKGQRVALCPALACGT